MRGDHDIVKSSFFLSLLLGVLFCLEQQSSANAHEHSTETDFRATSAIPKIDKRVLPSNPNKQTSSDVTASIPDLEIMEGGQSELAMTPTNLVGRWTVKSVRTQDNNLRKVQKLLLNPAVLTLREDGQFTLTAGCAHNTGTIRWNEEHFSLGMVLSNKAQCNKAQRQVEERILQMLNMVSQLERKDANQLSFQDESGQDLITLSRAN